MNARNFVISLVIFLAFSPRAWSQTTHRWTGNNNNNWDNAGNWGDASGYPDGVNDNVLFNNTGIRRNIDLRGGNRDVHNATFNLSGGTDYTFDSNTSGSGTFRLNGDLSITAAGESITFHSATSGGNGIDLVQAAAGNWTNNGGLLIVHSNLTGSAGITMNGNVTFNRPNSYTGNFTIQSGTTTLNAGTAFANAVVTLNQNNGINFNGLSGASFGALQGSGNISLGGTQLTVGSNGSDRTFSGGLTGDAFLGASFTYSGSNQLTLSGSMNGPKSVTVTNGNLRFQNGSFSVGGPAQLVLNGGNASITQGATLKLSAVGPDTGSDAILNSNTLVVDGGRFLTARITSNTDGVLNLAADPAGNSALEIGAINGESTSSSTFAGTLSGTATARKIGTGTWTLTHANPFSGTMRIDEGSVVLGVGSALQNATVEINLDNGLNINGLNATIGALAGSGDLNLGGRILTIDGNGQSTTYSGDLSGNDSSKLTYSGADIQTLMGTTGSVGVLSSTGGGELKLSGVNLTATADIEPAGVAISGSKLTISDGSLLHFTSGELTTALNGLTTIAGNGTTLTVDNPVFSIVGGQTIVEDNAELIASRNNIAANSSPGSGSMIARSGADVTINGDTTIGQNVGDTGDLLVTGTGTTYQTDSMELGGSSFSSGGTGTVNVETDGSLIVTSTTTFYSNASTLTIDDASLTTDQLSDNSGAVGSIAISDPASGAALTVGTSNGSSTFDGIITDAAGGPGSIDKVGIGTFVLTGASSFSGGVAVSDGTLLVNNSSGSATGTGGVTVKSGGTLGGTGSAAGLTTVESGGTVAPGASAGELNLGGVTFNTGSTFAVQLGGTTPGSGYDRLDVTGTATLAGTLDLSYINPFTASPGQTFVILTAGTLVGTFDSVTYPDGQVWFIEYDTGTGEVIVGPCNDSDSDGVCNADDVCPGFDDDADADSDGVPDGCDACPGFDDHMDIDSDGVPDACDTDCSGFPVHVSTAQELIDAIHCANGQPDANTIYLDADITLTAADNTDASQGPNGLPIVLSPIVIEGQNHIIERDTSAPFFRIFRVNNSPSSGTLSMYNTTLRNGLLDGSVAAGYRGGAAVLVVSAQLNMNNCILMDNNGHGTGGAILLRGISANATLDGVVMSGNQAVNGGEGGAIGLINGQLTVHNSIIAGNQGYYNGSAITVGVTASQATITNTIISGNYGAFISADGFAVKNRGTLTMVNCSLAGNRGTTGGGLYTGTGGHSTVINSLIWGNAVSTESQIHCDGTLDVSYTGIEGGLAGITGAGTINDIGGNLSLSSSDPVFVAPVAPSSAPTTAGDYHLAPNSVAIDQGSNTEATNAGLTTDFEGDSRIIGMTVDMGADEATCSLDGDDDGDGVCNSMDICPGGDDNVDGDDDGVPDFCDLCPQDNPNDSDTDGVCDSVDACPGFDDNVDSDTDGIPDACDTCPGVPNVHNETQDAYYPTIQAALDAAQDGDLIQLGACTFEESGLTIPQGVNLTLQGAGYAETTIDCLGAVAGISINGGATPNTSVIRDLAITGGGGNRFAIELGNSDAPTIQSVVVQQWGGNGIIGGGANVVLDRCFFVDNATDYGIAVGPSSLIRQCVIVNTGTTVSVFGIGGSTQIVNSTINSAGGVYVEDGIALNLVNSIVKGPVSVATTGTLNASRSMFVGATGDNIDADPVLSDSYRLVAGSPAIDAANYDAYIAAGGGTADVDDQPRTHDDAGIVDTGTGTITYLDIGAAEFGGLTDSDSDGVGDAVDACPGFDDNVDTDNDGMPDGCDACPNRAPADVSGDGMTTTDDIVFFAAVLIDPDSATPDEFCAADINEDNSLDGLDVQKMVDLLLTP